MRQASRFAAAALLLLGTVLAEPSTWQVGYHCPEGTVMVGLAVDSVAATEGVQLVCRNMSDPTAATVVAGLPVSGMREPLGKRTTCFGSRSFVTSLRYAVSSLQVEENAGHLNPVVYVAITCSGGEQLSLDVSHALRVAERLTVREAGCKDAAEAAVAGWIVSHTPGSTADSNNASMRLLCERMPAAMTIPEWYDYDLPDVMYSSVIKARDAVAAASAKAEAAAGAALHSLLDEDELELTASASSKLQPSMKSFEQEPPMQHAFPADGDSISALFLDRMQQQGMDKADAAADKDSKPQGTVARKLGQDEPGQAEEKLAGFFARAADIEYYDDWWGTLTAGAAADDGAHKEEADRELARRLEMKELESQIHWEQPEKLQAAMGSQREKHQAWADMINFFDYADEMGLAIKDDEASQQDKDTTAATSGKAQQGSSSMEPRMQHFNSLTSWRRLSENEKAFTTLLDGSDSAPSHDEMNYWFGFDPYMMDEDYYGDDAEYEAWLRALRKASAGTFPEPVPATSADSAAAAAATATTGKAAEDNALERLMAGNWDDYDYEAYYSDLFAAASRKEARQQPLLGVMCGPNCAGCNMMSGECYVCEKGFSLEAHRLACEPCPPGCDDCSNVSNPSVQCDKCNAQHELDADTAACIPTGLSLGWQGSLAKSSGMERRGLEATNAPRACEYPCLSCENGACSKCAVGYGVVGNECVAFNITGAWQRHFYGFDGRKIDVLSFEAGSFYNLLSEAHHQVNVQFDGLVDEEGTAGAIALTRAVALMYGPHKAKVELKIDDAGNMWTLLEVNGEQLTNVQDARRGSVNASLSLADPWRTAVRAYSLPASGSKSAGEAVTLQTPLLGLTVTRRGRDLELHLVMHAAPGAATPLHGIVGRTAQSAALAASAQGHMLAPDEAMPSLVPAADYQVDGLYGADFRGNLFRPVDPAKQDAGALNNLLDIMFSRWFDY